MTIHQDVLIHTPEGRIPIIALYQHYGVSIPFDIYSVSAAGNRIVVKATVKDSPHLKNTLDIGIRCSKNQQVVIHPSDPLYHTTNPHGLVWRTLYANQSLNRVVAVYHEQTDSVEPYTIQHVVTAEGEVSVPMFCLTIPSTGLYIAGNLNFLLGA